MRPAIGEGHHRLFAISLDIRRSGGLEGKAPHGLVGLGFRLRK
jgi:hypothetical protein